MIKIITLKGNAYTRGLKYGQECKREIHEVLGSNWSSVNDYRRSPLTNIEVIDFCNEKHDFLITEYGIIAKELKGLADGAGISIQQAVFLQYRRELINLTDNSDCSTFTSQTYHDGPIFGQTIDLNGIHGDYPVLLRIYPEENYSKEILMFTFTGLLGYIGMNSDGLSIGINMVLSDGWKVGLSPYLMIRYLLEKKKVSQVEIEILNIKPSSSRCFVICDKTESSVIEFTPEVYKITKGENLFHTNHFLHKDLVPKEKLNFFTKNSSLKRLNRIEELFLIAKEKDKDEEYLFDKIFSDHKFYPTGICTHSDNLKRSRTVASIIIRPIQQTMYIRLGSPCKGNTKRVRMSPKIHKNIK